MPPAPTAPPRPDQLTRHVHRSAWQELEATAGRLLPLSGLAPDAYAVGHAAFEQRSDQRRLLAGWLSARLRRRATARTQQELTVLSVGCGDGALDVAVARDTLHGSAVRLRLLGLEPHADSARRWAARASTLPRTRCDVTVGRAEDLSAETRHDLATAAHSLYYVRDLRSTIVALLAGLSPGGELCLALASRQGLNRLGSLLAPVDRGQRQWWAEDLRAVLDTLPVQVCAARVMGRLDLTDCQDGARAADAVLDFTAQAVLPAALRRCALDALRDLALPGRGLVVPHPVEVFTVRGR